MSDLGNLLAAIRRVECCVESSASWERKFEAVFAAYQDTIVPLLSATGLTFDWCDPDMDYEDDVRAFAAALCGDFKRDVEALAEADVHAALLGAVEACERLVAVAAAAGDERLAAMARPAAGTLRRQLAEREEKKS